MDPGDRSTDGRHGEQLGFGPQGPERRWPRWLLLAAVAAAGVVAVVNLDARSGEQPSASPSPTLQGGPAQTAETPVSAGPPRVERLANWLPGASGDWELFARGPDAITRIEPGRQRATRTPVPALQSGGPVSFVVGGDWAVVRPLDHVPGYLVPDGEPARRLRGVLGRHGLAFPGPTPETAWASADRGARSKLVLTRVKSREIVASVPLGGRPLRFPLATDGAGGVLLTSRDGSSVATVNGIREVSPFRTVASGPTTLVVQECDEPAAGCTVVVDRGTGARQELDLEVDPDPGPPGVVSPDGRLAAIADGRTRRLSLVDLRTGSSHEVPDLRVEPEFRQALAWSPSGRWLFVVTASGGLVAVDARDRRTETLWTGLEQVHQIVLRR
jgi:hypothetical protein